MVGGQRRAYSMRDVQGLVTLDEGNLFLDSRNLGDVRRAFVFHLSAWRIALIRNP